MLRVRIDLRSGDGPWCGDFAEHFPVSAYEDAVVVGDVAGASVGVPEAAHIMRVYLRSALLRSTSLPACLAAADLFFARSIMSESIPFISLFVAIGDSRSGILRYASAGHEPALLFDRSGGHRHLDPTGPILGIQSMIGPHAFQERAIVLEEGAVLVVVTDGITEARRVECREITFFGSTGIARAFRDARLHRLDPADTIHRAARAHARGSIRDDASVVVFA